MPRKVKTLIDQHPLPWRKEPYFRGFSYRDANGNRVLSLDFTNVEATTLHNTAKELARLRAKEQEEDNLVRATEDTLVSLRAKERK